MNLRRMVFSLEELAFSLSAQPRYRTLFFCLLLMALGFTTGCSNTPPTPDWQVNAFSASERAMHAQLTGQTRVENLEWNRARSEIARTGQLPRLATLELLRCAGLMASLQATGCPEFMAVQNDAAATDLAYAQYLMGEALVPSSIALLPAAQQAIAESIPSVGYKNAMPSALALARLQEIKDPLSRLVAASVLWRTGFATPEIVEQAVQTASEQGWRVPLIAWLNVQGQQAHKQGHERQAQSIARRLQVIEQGGRVKP